MRPREAVAFAVLAALLVISAIMLCGGCRTGATFVEGTRFRMGVYVPLDGQLYGLQVIEFLNGTALVSSNGVVDVTRSYSATNSYLGIVQTAERTETCAQAR